MLSCTLQCLDILPYRAESLAIVIFRWNVVFTSFPFQIGVLELHSFTAIRNLTCIFVVLAGLFPPDGKFSESRGRGLELIKVTSEIILSGITIWSTTLFWIFFKFGYVRAILFRFETRRIADLRVWIVLSLEIWLKVTNTVAGDFFFVVWGESVIGGVPFGVVGFFLQIWSPCFCYRLASSIIFPDIIEIFKIESWGQTVIFLYWRSVHILLIFGTFLGLLVGIYIVVSHRNLGFVRQRHSASRFTACVYYGLVVLSVSKAEWKGLVQRVSDFCWNCVRGRRVMRGVWMRYLRCLGGGGVRKIGETVWIIEIQRYCSIGLHECNK